MFTKDLSEHNFDSTNLRQLGLDIEKSLKGEDHFASIHWRGIEIVKADDYEGFEWSDDYDGSYKMTIEVHVFRGKPETGETDV